LREGRPGTTHAVHTDGHRSSHPTWIFASNLAQRDLDVDCAEVYSINYKRKIMKEPEDSLRSDWSLELSTCRAEEEEELARKRQAAIDARMGSVRGALVLRLEGRRS
tara:strand:- start:110 stop:430 length:321 start_codon:yes stop_codon:yes gene_type:complete